MPRLLGTGFMGDEGPQRWANLQPPLFSPQECDEFEEVIDKLVADLGGSLRLRSMFRAYMRTIFKPHITAYTRWAQATGLQGSLRARANYDAAKRAMCEEMTAAGIPVDVSPEEIEARVVSLIVDSAVEEQAKAKMKRLQNPMLETLGFTAAKIVFALPQAWMLAKAFQLNATATLFTMVVMVLAAMALGAAWQYTWRPFASSVVGLGNNLLDPRHNALSKPALWAKLVGMGILNLGLLGCLIVLDANFLYSASNQPLFGMPPVNPLKWNTALMMAGVFSGGLAAVSLTKALFDAQKSALEEWRVVRRNSLLAKLSQPFGRLVGAELELKQAQEQGAELAARARAVWMRLLYALWGLYIQADEAKITAVLSLQQLPSKRCETEGDEGGGRCLDK